MSRQIDLILFKKNQNKKIETIDSPDRIKDTIIKSNVLAVGGFQLLIPYALLSKR